MDVQLAYGRTGLRVDLPEGAEIIQAPLVPGLPDEPAAILSALRQPIASAPLREKVHPGDTVVIAHSDITRATPNDRLLPVILAELEEAGVRREDISLLNALGTHRSQTPAELRAMLGDFVVDHYRCEQHDAYDDSNLVALGATRRGHPVRLNRRFLEAKVRILTGFIEPHFFAGFSGGPKGVLPALAGAESVLSNHGWDMIGDPNATWGVTAGNPIWEEMREVALRADPTFLVNVTLNARRDVTGVFAGDMLAAHALGCEFVRAHAMAPVEALFDVVLTTNSGYPLDQNLYQTVKGMSAAARIMRPGGAMIMAAACADGLPDGGHFITLLGQGGTPRGVLDLLSQPGFSAQDQWQVQLQAQIQLQGRVLVYSDGLSDAQIHSALLEPCRDLPGTLRSLLAEAGLDARLGVLPEGPQTIAYLRAAEPVLSAGRAAA